MIRWMKNAMKLPVVFSNVDFVWRFAFLKVKKIIVVVIPRWWVPCSVVNQMSYYIYNVKSFFFLKSKAHYAVRKCKKRQILKKNWKET